MKITMFGPFDWNDTWYSRHHLTVGLAARHRVTVVADAPDARTLLRHPLSLWKPGRVVSGFQGFMRYESPGWLPQVHGWWPIRRALQSLRAASIERLTTPELCYVWRPDYGEAAAPLTDIPLVYHCYDKYDRYTGGSGMVREWEEGLARRAELCVVASTMLGDHVRELGARRVLVLRHGVDANQFRPGLDVPEALRQVPHPRLGVVARLNEALDAAALAQVAADRPDWSVVLVGGVHFSDPARGRRFTELCRMPNVYHVGPQPQVDIPRWLCGFDVGLACYDLATWGPYNQPIKLYEYLACGLPVVSTDIQAAREFGDLIERSAGTDEWVPAIERALTPAAPEMAQRRLAFAQTNSWERRVEELDDALRTIPGVHSRS
jgi:glycosyltransferase involved in cell wall biosynthesis